MALSIEEVNDLIIKIREGNLKCKEILINENISLVWSLVHRYKNTYYDKEDLFQIGCLGLLKAIDKFDISYNVAFSTYAVPLILGEIKKFTLCPKRTRVNCANCFFCSEILKPCTKIFLIFVHFPYDNTAP